jgi:hypothetical protein
MLSKILGIFKNPLVMRLLMRMFQTAIYGLAGPSGLWGSKGSPSRDIQEK